MKSRTIPFDRGGESLGKLQWMKRAGLLIMHPTTPDSVAVAGTETNSFEHIMGTPILSQDRVTGLMAVWRTGKGLEFQPAELEFLKNLAQQAAIAIENARLFQETQRSESELRTLFASMNDVIIVYDKDGRYIRIAPTSPSLLIRPPDEMIGKYIKEVVPPDLHDQFMDVIHKALSGNKTIKTEYPLNIDGRNYLVRCKRLKTKRRPGSSGSAQRYNRTKNNELIQSAITHIAESALTSKSMEDLVKSVHEAIGIILPAKNFYLALYDPGTSLITFPYFTDEYDTDWSPRKLGKGLTSYVIRTGKPLRTTP